MSVYLFFSYLFIKITLDNLIVILYKVIKIVRSLLIFDGSRVAFVVFAWEYVNMVVTSRCFAFARYHARTNLNILIPRATRLTLQPNSDNNRRPKETKGSGDEHRIWKKFWVENSTSLLYLPISSLADTRKILRNMLRNFLFCSSWQFKQEKSIFWKASFSQNKNILLNPLEGLREFLIVMQSSTSSRFCITVSNSPIPSRVYMRLCKHGKRFL